MSGEDYSSENKKRMILALAIMLGAAADSYSDIPPALLAQAKAIYKDKNFGIDVEQEARMPEREVQIKIAELGNSASIELYKIVGVEDSHTCPDCARWQGTTVTMHDDGKHKTVQDFINDHGFHVNCRCSLQPLDVGEIPLNKINPRYEERKAANPKAYNTAWSVDQLVFC